MSDDWKPGDLALCLKMGSWEMLAGRPPTCGMPQPGGIYTVVEIISRPPFGMGLLLQGLADHHFLSTRFRRIPPHEADAEDAETIRLLTGKPIKEPVA